MALGGSFVTATQAASFAGTFDGSSLRGGRLAEHQQSALAWACDRPMALLADPPGSGKTAVACALIAHAFDVDGAVRGIWVTEAHLIPQTLRELRRFLPGLPSAAWTRRRGEPLTVVSYEMLTRRTQDLVEFDAQVIVLDEASALKNHGPRADAAKLVIARAWQRFALTATPMEVDAMETYRLLRMLGANKLPSEWQFEQFCLWQHYPSGDRKVVGVRPETLPELRAALAPYVLRREIDDLGLALPDVLEEQVWVTLTPPQHEAYLAAARGPNDLERARRRDRACMSAAGRSAKAEAALAWLDADKARGKVVMFADQLHHLDIVQRLLDDAGIGWVRIDGSYGRSARTDAVTAFRDDPRIRVLLGTRVLERGIDGLQHAEVLVSLGSSFNPAREAQRLGRLRRPGAAHPVVRHVTFLTDTQHEHEKWATVQRRAQDSDAVIGQSAQPSTSPSRRDGA